MSDNKKEIGRLRDELQTLVSVLHKGNKLARKRNRIAKQEYRQSVLNYEQVERQYLIEKSRLQPTFRLSVTEFLTCEPDFVNDPEQASEVKFLFDRGVGIDQRILRIKITVKGDAEYMQPSMVIPLLQDEEDERAYAMSDLLYFVPVDRLEVNDPQLETYLVYRDKTTLPVIHKYRFDQRTDSTLLRWDVAHLDTAYADSHLSKFNNISNCSALFLSREQA